MLRDDFKSRTIPEVWAPNSKGPCHPLVIIPLPRNQPSRALSEDLKDYGLARTDFEAQPRSSVPNPSGALRVKSNVLKSIQKHTGSQRREAKVGPI